MRVINHLALAVHDPARSLRFYREKLSVQGSVREEDYGFVLTTLNGVAAELPPGYSRGWHGQTYANTSQPGAGGPVRD